MSFPVFGEVSRSPVWCRPVLPVANELVSKMLATRKRLALLLAEKLLEPCVEYL